MTLKLVHAGILAGSLDASVRFYCDVMGFKKEKKFRLSAEIMEKIFGLALPAEVEVLSSDSGSVEIFMLEGAPEEKIRSCRSAVSHFAVEVDDLNGYLERIRSNGGTLKPVDRDGRTIWFAVDPDGSLIELKGK